MNDMVHFLLSTYQLEKEDLNEITILYEDSTQLKYYYKIGYPEKKNKQFFNYFVQHFK